MNYADFLIFLALLTAAIGLFTIAQNRHHDMKYVIWGAIGLEFLGVVLSVYWAVTVVEDKIMALFFVLGWIAMVAIRAAVLPRLITNIQNGLITHSFVGVLVALIAYGALYSTGLFHAVNDSGDKAQERLESSAPAKALDDEIKITQQRLSGLAAFADAGKAHEVQEKAQAAQAEYQSKQQAVNENLAALAAPAFPSKFAKYMNADCSPKQTASGLYYRTKAKNLCPEWQAMTADYDRKRRVLESQLGGLAPSVSTGYAAKHAEYTGLQQHLITLKKERANLAESGQGVVSQWRGEDRLIAWAFNIAPEKANRIKWLILVAIFDILALLARIFAALNTPHSSEDDAEKAKFKALMRGGFSMSEALQIMGGAVGDSVPNAKTAPQLKQGGHVLSDGLVHAHAGEAVLNAGATNELEQMHPALIDKLNAKHRSNTEQQDTAHCDISQSDISHCDNRNASAKPAKAAKPTKKGLQTLHCEHCNTEFKQRTVWQKFCSTECRNEHNGFRLHKRKSQAKNA